MELDKAIVELKPLAAAYVLAKRDDFSYLYKGSCRDLPERLRDHRAGRVAKTKSRRPLRLVYFEYCSDYSAALQRERFLKSGKGREFLQARVAEWHTQQT